MLAREARVRVGFLLPRSRFGRGWGASSKAEAATRRGAGHRHSSFGRRYHGGDAGGKPMSSSVMLGNTFAIGGKDPELYSLTDQIVRPDQKIPLEAAMELASKDPIWANRGQAIQAYAQLEQSLCQVLAAVGDMSLPVAGIVFFKIVSTQARSAIIEK